MKEKGLMTIKEAERLHFMKQIDKKKLTLREVSEQLCMSLRQTKRIRKRYLEEGEIGLISRKRGMVSNRKISEKTRLKVLDLMRGSYEGFGPTFASEKLEERDGIKLSAETLRKWLIEEGVWTVKRKKTTKVHQRRPRRSRFGEMIQGDGSPHDWFEGRGEKCSLLIFIDDATSLLTSGRFFPTETTEGYLEVLEIHLKKYGRPGALYVDKHSIFRQNQKEIRKGDLQTHFGKVLQELDIQLICAHSPQAKGRVERANSTLQDRLVKEMRLKGISSLEEANDYLPTFIEKFNEQFGREPIDQEDAHRPLRKEIDLERIFARKETRKLSKELSFSYEGTTYHLNTDRANRIRKTHVELIIRPNKPMIVEVDKKPVEYTQWKEAPYKRAPILDSKELQGLWKSQPKKPTRRHPWR